MGAPTLFLDVDGVVSPLGEAAVLRPGYDHLQPRAIPSPAALPFDPRVLATIQALHTTGLVRIQWLTTWEPGMVNRWLNAGLGPFPVAERIDGRRRWWKANVVERWLDDHPAQRVIWADDDIPATVPFRSDRLLVVRPRRDAGLTLSHMARITSWLDRPATAEPLAEETA